MKKIFIVILSLCSTSVFSAERDIDDWYGVKGINIYHMMEAPKNKDFIFVNTYGDFRLVSKKNAANFIKENLSYYNSLLNGCKRGEFELLNPALETVRILAIKGNNSDKECIVEVNNGASLAKCNISRKDLNLIKDSKSENYKRENFEFFSDLTGDEDKVMTRSCKRVKLLNDKNYIEVMWQWQLYTISCQIYFFIFL